MDLEKKVRSLENDVQTLKTKVNELYEKSAARYDDITVILKVL